MRASPGRYRLPRLPIALGVMLALSVDARPGARLTQPRDVEPTHSINAQVKGRFSNTTSGGAPSGFQIQAGGVTWEVDMSATPALQQMAEQLNGKPAIVTGTFAERREGPRLRRILTAKRLEAGAVAHDESVNVTIVGTLKTGVMAIGAESTGVTITANGVTWDLEVERRQRAAVSALHGAIVRVVGTLRNAGATEVTGRFIVKVRTVSRRGSATPSAASY